MQILPLDQFLDNKSLFYDKIDYGAVSKSWDILQKHITLPYVIHIVGTNGKGTTGRFLASFLYQNNKNVLHYSSPHIIRFNERIWINGKDSSDNILEDGHKQLQTILDQDLLDKLTYFEYTTLLALLLSDNFDYIVLEAGLGGEFDATNVVQNNISVFTPIGLDHQEFLGDTIEQIATTKLKSCNNRYILANQPFIQVEDIANTVLQNKTKIPLKQLTANLDAALPLYLTDNLNLALNIIKELDLNTQDLKLPKLFGRFERIKNNIIIDVGHNPLAAQVISKQLIKENKKVVLIYNSFKNKDYFEVLKKLKPIIKEVMIINIKDQRVLETSVLQDCITKLDIKIIQYDTNNLNHNETYLVFGSFLVVEQFLKDFKQNEKR
jgi:dihydrofolate synthase/folylpolyglutamate synthase